MWKHLKLPICIAFSALVACGGGTQQVQSTAEPAPNIATLDGVVTLADLGAACARTASDTQAGAVVIRGDLRDTDRQVTIAVPCAVQLAGTGSVHLARSTIGTGIINFSDKASAAGRNEFQLSEVTFAGRPESGFLLELTDPEDKVEFSRSVVTYPLGIVIRSNGDRNLPDSGGSVRMSATKLTTTGPASTVSLTASTNKGVVQLAGPVIDSPGIVMVAEQCAALIDGKMIDCRAATLGADLKQQAQAVTAN